MVAEAAGDVVKQAASTLLGIVTGRDASVRMIVRMGSTRSMTPTSTRSPPADDSSTLSPTTKGRDKNCIKKKDVKLDAVIVQQSVQHAATSRKRVVRGQGLLR